MKRNALKRGAVIGRVDYERIYVRDRGRCHICRRPEPVPRDELEFDHVIPLSKGGEHTTGNIAVAHRTCNRRKFNRVVTLF